MPQYVDHFDVLLQLFRDVPDVARKSNRLDDFDLAVATLEFWPNTTREGSIRRGSITAAEDIYAERSRLEWLAVRQAV